MRCEASVRGATLLRDLTLTDDTLDWELVVALLAMLLQSGSEVLCSSRSRG